MSGADNIQFNNLERALSTDLNNTEAVLTRTAADNLRYGLATQGYPDGSVSSMPTQTIQNVVLGGLAVTPSGGTGVLVSPGVLCQDSASLTPTPGTYDSDYRIARLEDVETIAVLTPGTDMYYLLEAQMVEVIASSELRDIYNPSTQTFVPTSVPKVIRRSIQFQWTAGTTTNFPVPTGGNWVPIAGLFRPSGGGNVTAAQIYDMRVFPRPRTVFSSDHDIAAVVYRRSYSSDSVGAVCRITADAQIGSERVWLKWGDPGNVLNLTDARVKDPTSTFADKDKAYLYLVPWSAAKIPAVGQNLPIMARETAPYVTTSTSRLDQRGVLVFSKVAPGSVGEITNGATLNLPAPFNGATAAAATAVCIGGFVINKPAADTYVRTQFANGNQVVRRKGGLDNVAQWGPPLTGADVVNMSLDWIPNTARHADYMFNIVPAGGAPSTPTVYTINQYDSSLLQELAMIRLPEDEGFAYPITWDLTHGTAGLITGPAGGTLYVVFQGFSEPIG